MMIVINYLQDLSTVTVSSPASSVSHLVVRTSHKSSVFNFNCYVWLLYVIFVCRLPHLTLPKIIVQHPKLLRYILVDSINEVLNQITCDCQIYFLYHITRDPSRLVLILV